MNNNNLDFWMNVLGDFASGFMIGANDSQNEKEKSQENEVEDLGYAVIIENDDNIQ
jgi:hypothetical protein